MLLVKVVFVKITLKKYTFKPQDFNNMHMKDQLLKINPLQAVLLDLHLFIFLTYNKTSFN